MQLSRVSIGVIVALMATGCSSDNKTVQAGVDEGAYLEEVLSPRSLQWVDAQNAISLKTLQSDARYQRSFEETLSIVTAKDRTHLPAQRGAYLYHFLQDEEHVKGLWRRTTVEKYLEKDVEWDTILDVDALNEKEKESWVFKGANCLEPEGRRCLLTLSRDGRDASVLREYDVESRAFVVSDGFRLPEAKSDGTWLDVDRLLVATDFGPGSLTDSGYARIVKVWQRGTPLSEAKTLFEGKKEDVSAGAMHVERPEGSYTLVFRSPSFFEQESFLVNADLSLTKIPLPQDASIRSIFQGQILATLRSEWKVAADNTIPTGSLVALPLNTLGAANPLAQLQTLFTPSESAFLADVYDTKSFLLLNIMDNIRNRVVKAAFVDGSPVFTPVAMPKDGAVQIVSTSASSDQYFALYKSFLIPSSLYLNDADKVSVVKQAPARFDAEPFTYEQLHAKSKDGTSVPYFIVRRKDIAYDGKTPTLLYGYGGFEISLGPDYLETAGKAWLEKGGAYVIANIRGGGEFGPAWHKAALKENRQRAYDDFIAVAEDLISRKITSPAKLGIQGGSNGGLLMGVMFTQRPDLFNAVLCQVPLLDMLRYHKLLAGNSWMGEYGNPDKPEEAAYIAKYSPYQNIVGGKKYPKVFFMTSTADDRVHPGHARKAAAKMESFGAPFLYYENRQGGHSAAENLEQSARFRALSYTYLYQQLMD